MAPPDMYAEGSCPSIVKKRRAHKRSKNGCRNCKLRRVKCDETQPSCKSCEKFMVGCNYDPKQPDLEGPYTRRLANIKLLSPVSLQGAFKDMINESLLANYPEGYGQPLQLQIQDLDMLQRWQHRTVLTIGSQKTAEIYQKEVIKSIARYPYVMHTVLALTAKHDRYLIKDGLVDSQQEALECYHTSRAAALFSGQLSRTSASASSVEHDMLWATAVFLGSLASGTVNGNHPTSVWPLKDGAAGEALSWVRVNEGLRLLWYLSQPFAPGRMFNDLVNSPDHTFILTKLDPIIQPGTEGIPDDFVELCRLDESSTLENHPYQKAVRTLLPLIDLPWTDINRLKFMSFSAMMDQQYKEKLHDKEPAALVLLAWWYALVLRSQWYLAKRASLECRSICIYLDREYPDDPLVQRMLEFPKIRTGLGKDNQFEGGADNPEISLESRWSSSRRGSVKQKEEQRQLTRSESRTMVSNM